MPVLLLLLLLTACQPGQPPATPATLPAGVSLSSPLAATRTLIGLLRERIEAVAAKDTERVRRLDGQILAVAATDEIRKLLDRYPLYLAVLGKQPVQRFVKTWAPVTAYYLPHADPSRSIALPAGEGAVLVHVPAPGVEPPAEIRVRCVRGTDGRWRVASVTLGPPTSIAPATRPATAPATQP